MLSAAGGAGCGWLWCTHCQQLRLLLSQASKAPNSHGAPSAVFRRLPGRVPTSRSAETELSKPLGSLSVSPVVCQAIAWGGQVSSGGLPGKEYQVRDRGQVVAAGTHVTAEGRVCVCHRAELATGSCLGSVWKAVTRLDFSVGVLC